MSRNVSSSWSGLDLSPLPHESLLSILWRIGWRNVLSPAQLTKLWKKEGYQFSKPGRKYNLKSINTEQMELETGWDLSGIPEPTIFDELGETAGILLIADVRICPVCLGHGYHSIWHQFRPLMYCPVHDCELRLECQSCGTSIGQYSVPADLLENPYCCTSCSKPIAGVMPELQAHIEFRQHQSEMIDSFHDLDLWKAEANKNLFPMLELISQNSGWQSNWIQWCRPLDLMLGIAHHLHPLPTYCTNLGYRDLSFIQWRFETDSDHSAAIQKYWLTLAERSVVPNLVYKTVLGQLHAWLDAQLKGSLAASIYPVLSGSQTIELWSRDPKELAFKMFRMKFERSDLDVSRSIHDTEIFDQPMLPFPWLPNGLPMSIFESVYPAAYANLIHTVLRARKNSKIVFPSLDLRDRTLVAHAWWQKNRTIHGFTVFPSIAKYPFGKTSFYRCTTAVRKR